MPVRVRLAALTDVPHGWSLQTLLPLFHRENEQQPFKLLVSDALATSAAVIFRAVGKPGSIRPLGVRESAGSNPAGPTGKTLKERKEDGVPERRTETAR